MQGVNEFRAVSPIRDYNVLCTFMYVNIRVYYTSMYCIMLTRRLCVEKKRKKHNLFGEKINKTEKKYMLFII